MNNTQLQSNAGDDGRRLLCLPKTPSELKERRSCWQNDFSFTPSYPKILSNLTTNISSNATAIKTAALAALKLAYFGFPVTVVEGKPNTGDNQAAVLNHQTLKPNAYGCGATIDNSSNFSQIDYLNNMDEAQNALQTVITNAQTETSALQNLSLIRAIGMGIGNSAAHEIAHQFLHSCCDMDSDPNIATIYNPNPSQPDPNARGAYNAGGCHAKSDPSTWLGYWPSPRINLRWEAPAAIQGLQNCLNRGWRIISPSCTQEQ